MRRMMSWFLTLALVLGLCACGQNAQATWQEQYDLGVRYLSEGNYEEAIVAFTAAIEIDPNRKEAYNGLADAYLALEDYTSVAAVWEGAQSQITDETLLSTLDISSQRYAHIQAGLESGEPGIWITRMDFDRQTLLDGGETEFQLMIIYRAPAGESLRVNLSTNSQEPRSWQWQAEYEEITTGIGVQNLKVSLIPALWEGPYFGIRVGLWNASESGNWDWITDDTWYITPDGMISDSYAPLNDFGAIEFIYRDDYKEFSILDASIQKRVETLARSVLTGDQDDLLSLVNTDSGFSDTFYTMWNGYKIEVHDDAEWENQAYDAEQATDKYKAFQIGMRPENGTGYYCFVFRSETTNTAGKKSWLDWSNSVKIIACPCVNWQWNGSVTGRDYHDYFWRDAEGTTCHTSQTISATGVMVDGLWDGVVTSTIRDISDWSPGGPDDSDETSIQTRVVQNGIIVEENGKLWDKGKGYQLISGGYSGGGVLYSDEQAFLYVRYW